MEKLGILGSQQSGCVPWTTTLNCSDLQSALVKEGGESCLLGHQGWADGVWMGNQGQNSEP